MAESAEIMRGSRVTMHFSLALFDGKEAISTFNEEPATITIGEGAMVPTLEMAIYGLKAGEEHTFELTPEQVAACIDEIGVGFMFAPLHHSAMKHAIGPRREMAVRTIFNVLGPLTNPAGATRATVDVGDEEVQGAGTP